MPRITPDQLARSIRKVEAVALKQGQPTHQPDHLAAAEAQPAGTDRHGAGRAFRRGLWRPAGSTEPS
jgi:hypothetical protein